MKHGSIRLAVMTAMLASGFSEAFALEQNQYGTDPFFTTSSGITSLNYQLIDLTPDDGISPSMTFILGSPFYGHDTHNIYINDQKTTFTTAGQLLVNNPVTKISPSGVVSGSLAPNSLSTNISISEKDYINNAKITQADDYGYISGKNLFLNENALVSSAGSSISFGLNRIVAYEDQGGPTGYVYRLEGEPEDVSYFTISPNTELRITGEIGTKLALDASALAQYNVNEMRVIASSTSSLLSHFLDPIDGSTSWNTGEAFEESINLNRIEKSSFYNSDACPKYCASNISDQQAFNFKLSNTTSNQMRGRIMAYSTSSLILQGSPVPEPATYALMTLGLVGVAVATRRRNLA